MMDDWTILAMVVVSTIGLLLNHLRERRLEQARRADTLFSEGGSARTACRGAREATGQKRIVKKVIVSGKRTTNNMMQAIIYSRPVGDEVYRELARVEQRPLFKACEQALGLEFHDLRSYIFQGAEMSEPYGHTRTAVYVVSKSFPVALSPGLAEYPLHYTSVPMGEYIFAGQCGHSTGYLVTKRNDKDQVMGGGHDTYPNMGYVVFSLRLYQDGLRVTGPLARDPVPEGWPRAN